MLFNIAIIDDEIKDLELTTSIVRGYFSEMDYSYQITQFTNPSKLVFGENYNVLFLDIEMPNIDGIDLAKKISDTYENSKIIFVTNHDYMVYDATKVAPFGFVRKSKIMVEMQEVLERVCKQVEKEQRNLVIYDHSGIIKIKLEDIIWIEVIKNNVLFHTVSEVIEIRSTLKHVLSLLPKSPFIKINKSYVVNIEHVDRILNDEIILSDGNYLLMNSKLKKQIKEVIISYIERNIV